MYPFTKRWASLPYEMLKVWTLWSRLWEGRKPLNVELGTNAEKHKSFLQCVILNEDKHITGRTNVPIIIQWIICPTLLHFINITIFVSSFRVSKMLCLKTSILWPWSHGHQPVICWGWSINLRKAWIQYYRSLLQSILRWVLHDQRWTRILFIKLKGKLFRT